MRKIIALITLGVFLTFNQAFAETKTFIISATVQNTSSVNITTSQIVGTQWTPVSGTALSFGTLNFNPTTGNLSSPKYFAVDIASSGPTNGFTTQVDYVEGLNPNPTGHGIGSKTTATFVKTSGSGSNTTDQTLSIGKKLLKDLNGVQISSTQLTGGWLRVYVGLVGLDPLAVPPDPSGAETFNASDKPGQFDGTLTFTTTAL